MKRAQFFIPGSVLIERQEPREGPCPVFCAWKPHTSQTFTDRKALLKFVAWPRSTQTGLMLREWLDSFPDVVVEKPELDTARMNEVSWGPEAHEVEPNENTKTII